MFNFFWIEEIFWIGSNIFIFVWESTNVFEKHSWIQEEKSPPKKNLFFVPGFTNVFEKHSCIQEEKSSQKQIFLFLASRMFGVNIRHPRKRNYPCARLRRALLSVSLLFLPWRVCDAPFFCSSPVVFPLTRLRHANVPSFFL